MSNEKKNPLIGAFRTPVAGAPPTSPPAEPSKEAKAPVIPTQPAKALPFRPPKPDEVKSPPSLLTKRRWQACRCTVPLPLIRTRVRSPPSLSKDDKSSQGWQACCAAGHPNKFTR